uniref:Uncharacterized protein n=1 Tax=Nelumbo nucifera TaxID=4432 RepID=A0A822YLT1_NELNU|nr:TPA_asm: hypothetical protein HUJ06_009159 [Nelumbo nucifera]
MPIKKKERSISIFVQYCFGLWVYEKPKIELL